MIISLEAVHAENAILHDYLMSHETLVEPETTSTDRIIPIDINCTGDELHFPMPRGTWDYEDEDDYSDKGDAIPTTRR